MKKNTVRVRLTRPAQMSGIVRGYMRSSGAPLYLLNGTRIDLEERDGSIIACKAEINDRPVEVSQSAQLKHLRATLENPLRGSYVQVIGAQVHDRTTTAIAAAICVNALRDLYPTASTVYLGEVLWHTVNGGRWDHLRDSLPTPTKRKRKVKLLVLSGIIANMEAERRGKVLDLLDKYEHVPRVLLIHGADPLNVCLNELRIKPNRLLQINSGRRVISI